MKKVDTKELVYLITKMNDSSKIKQVANLISKIYLLESEQIKLSSLQERIEALQVEITEEIKGYEEDKPRDKRGRKKKQTV